MDEGGQYYSLLWKIMEGIRQEGISKTRQEWQLNEGSFEWFHGTILSKWFLRIVINFMIPRQQIYADYNSVIGHLGEEW